MPFIFSVSDRWAANVYVQDSAVTDDSDEHYNALPYLHK